MMPRVPSEPRNIRSGEGPAPEPDSRRTDHPHGFGQVVDVGVERREVPARGASGKPAAQAGESEGLREMAQRETVRAELIFDRGPQRARLDPCRPTHPVDLEHRTQCTDVHRDRRLVEARLDTADHRAATTVWDRRNLFSGTPIQHIDNVLFAARPRDQVGHMVEVAQQVAGDVAKSLAARMTRTIYRIGRADPRQRFRRADPGREQRERGRVRRLMIGKVMAGKQRRYAR